VTRSPTPTPTPTPTPSATVGSAAPSGSASAAAAQDDHAELEHEIARLESGLREAIEQVGRLRERARHQTRDRVLARARVEVDEIRDEWSGVRRRTAIVALALLLALFLGSYLFYMNLGWYADQRVLPRSSDWLLDQLPQWNWIPLLTWGWLVLHVYAVGTALLYLPRRIPFLIWLIAVYLCVRTLFVFLSPIGAPERILDMRELDTLFAMVAGEYTFQNEFIFSGHTAVPFLFFLFFEARLHKAVMLVGSVTMALAVLVTHNHYSVDVLSAWFVGYAVFALARSTWGVLARGGAARARAAGPEALPLFEP
jgi:hypothetical protein